MTLLAIMFGMIGAALPNEGPAFVETAAHWYAPRQTMRAAAKLVEKWTGNAELLEQELVKAGWSPPRQLDRSSWMTELLGIRPDDKPVAWVAYKVADMPCDAKGTQVVFLYPIESARLGEIVLKYNTRRDSNGVTKVFLGEGRVEGCLLPSSDGRWIAFALSPHLELALAGMARLPFVLQPRREGTLSELCMSSNVMAMAVQKGLKVLEGDRSKERIRKLFRERMSGAGDMTISVAVTERGVDLCTEIADGVASAWKPLATDRWQGVPENAVASLVRTDAFKLNAYWDFFGAALTVFKECGLSLDDFCACQSERGIVRRTFDAAEALEHFSTRTNELVSAVMEKGLIRKAMSLWRTQTMPEEGKDLVECTFAIKGYRTNAPIAERFLKTLPEAKGMEVGTMQFLSPYSIIRAFVEASQNKTAKMQMPKEAICGIAGASGREGRNSVERWRISADEITRLAVAFRLLKGSGFGDH